MFLHTVILAQKRMCSIVKIQKKPGGESSLCYSSRYYVLLSIFKIMKEGFVK